MEEFILAGENRNYLKISFQEVYGFPETTCHWGGYEVRATIEIKSGNFMVKSIFWTSTGEIHEFYKGIEICNRELKGAARFANYEDNLKFVIEYDSLGHANIHGRFYELNNELKFEFNSDQTFMLSTLKDLKGIVLKYGDMKGIKNSYL